jgi:hypothetical protein
MKKWQRSSMASWLVCLFCLPSIFTSGNGLIFDENQPNDLATVANKSVTNASQPVSMSVQVLNCKAWGYCDETPELRFTLEYQGSDSSDYVMHIQVGDRHYESPSSPAEIKVSLTDNDGVNVMYWVESATTGSIYGQDDFRMRYIKNGSQYILELLGDQWESDIPSGALIWNIFPPLEVFEDGWAKRIEDPDELDTEIDYTLLAGKLIWEGIVTPIECGDNGLLGNGAANTCGMETAREEVTEWQNLHNQDIQEASLNALVPARLLKGVIGQESQFYAKWELPKEYGLGMLTERGVDMLLQWNEAYFFYKCSLIYGADYCKRGYLNIPDDQQAVLIGYIMKDIGTVDEYAVIAAAIYASCVQANYIVSYYTDEAPADVADYETLWRISLGVYHAGFGCMSDAVLNAWDEDSDTLTWENIASHLVGDCNSAIDYFDKVVNYSVD